LSYGPLSKNYFLNNFFLIFVAEIFPTLSGGICSIIS